MKNQKYYRVILNKKQKDVVIDALSRMKYVLPEDADYRSEVVRVLYIFEKLRAVKEPEVSRAVSECRTKRNRPCHR